MNSKIEIVTNRIIERSKKSRKIYLSRVETAKIESLNRHKMGCSNFAHTIAAMSDDEKELLKTYTSHNMAIITAYNDMLSAHQPYYKYPDILKNQLAKYNSTAQVASGVPAMCDGVTQGYKGMELSLFSRDNIAMSSAVGLSHDVFDGVFYLGVCDKIVPGLLISALNFGHLPSIFVPSGPMPSGISNKEKAEVRQQFAQGKVSQKELLEVESKSYHSCGTCTFFGTANSNQMFLEMMGLQLQNASFVNTNTALRDELTKHSAKVLKDLVDNKTSISDIICEKSFVNAIIGLMATGGSTNHTIHLIAIAKSCGIILTWEDFDEISTVIPLLCKMYPNGSADVNHFRDAGGMSVVIAQLLEAGLIHNDVNTIVGFGLENYIKEPYLKDNILEFINGKKNSSNLDVISDISKPFKNEGGLKLCNGNLGESVVKTSALKDEQLYLKAPAVVFNSQEELQEEFKKGTLKKDFIAVVRFQGPKSNGMPELHKLMSPLGVLQDMGYKVAIVTDGRMSGASGKVPSAIHLSPEASNGGLISKIQNDDIIELDIENGRLELLVSEDELTKRKAAINPYKEHNIYGLGTQMYSIFRKEVSEASSGATVFKLTGEEEI